MTTKTDDLKPCPCCGGEAAFNTTRTTCRETIKLNKRDTGYGVNCVVCGINNRGLVLGYESKALAAEAWNRRAALQSQSMPPEISRDLLGKIVDEVFDGAIEDASVIEDIYRVVARECVLQSQDREDAVQAAINKLSAMTPRPPKAITYDQGWEIINVVQCELCPAIDRARRSEGGGE